MGAAGWCGMGWRGWGGEPGFRDCVGLLAEGFDLVGGAALPVGLVGVGDMEVPAEVVDDVVQRAGVDVFLEVRRVQAVSEFTGQSFDLGGVRVALDDVFHLAEDAFAGGGAVISGGDFFQVLGEEDGAADGPGDAVEGDGEVLRGGVRGWEGGGGGLDLLEMLLVDGLGHVVGHVDEVAEDLLVVGLVLFLGV